jgi:hypothetical protein
VVGSAATIRQAWDVLGPSGVATAVGVAPVGVAPVGVEVSLPAIEFLSEKTITGGCYGSSDVHAALDQLVRLVVDRRLDLGDVVSYLIGLDDVEAALEGLRRRQGARSVILIDQEMAGVRARRKITEVFDGVRTRLTPPARPQILPVLSGEPVAPDTPSRSSKFPH